MARWPVRLTTVVSVAVLSAVAAAGVLRADAAATEFPNVEQLAVEARVTIDGVPGGIAVAAGSVWVASMTTGFLNRIDPRTNRITGRIRYGPGASAPRGEDPVAFGGGALWVADQTDGTLVKIDPRAMRVVWKRPIDSIWGVGFFNGSVWVPQFETYKVARVAPATGIVRSRADATGPTDLGAAGGDVWVLEHRSTSLLRLDGDTGRRVTSISFEARAPERMAVGSGAVWVTDPLGWIVVRVETRAPHRTREVAMPGGGDTMPGNIAAGGGFIWVATIQRHLLRIDPRTNTVTGAVAITPRCGRPRTGCVLDVAYGLGSVWVGDTRSSEVVRIGPTT